MNKDKEKALLEEFGDWFITNDPMRSLICFGLECGDGWEPILRDLFEEIRQILYEEGVPQGDYEIVQIKEKFGSLRVYDAGVRTDAAAERIWDAISRAEDRSCKTCEFCGKPGRERNTGWIFTLCDKCYEERSRRRDESK